MSKIFLIIHDDNNFGNAQEKNNLSSKKPTKAFATQKHEIK